jgi:nucleoside 2-deoxyribosyltransferase
MSAEDSNASGNGRAEPDAEGPSSDGDGECFVIAPIGDPRTDTRRQTDGLLEEAIRPVVEEKIGLDVTAAHQMPEAGSITRQVLQQLLEAELVVADLTGLNANVMYELAVRHAKGRPVVPIAEKGTSLPFDITTERTIFYEESFHGLNELKPKLKDAARAALGDEEPDNPIYRAQQDFQMREAVAGDDAMEYVMNRLDEIESAISKSSHPEDPVVGGIDELETHEFAMEETLEEAQEIAKEVSEDSRIAFATVTPKPGPENCRLEVMAWKGSNPQRIAEIVREGL